MVWEVGENGVYDFDDFLHGYNGKGSYHGCRRWQSAGMQKAGGYLAGILSVIVNVIKNNGGLTVLSNGSNSRRILLTRQPILRSFRFWLLRRN